MEENYPKLFSKNYTKVSGPKGKEIIDYIKGIETEQPNNSEIANKVEVQSEKSLTPSESLTHSPSGSKEITVEELFKHKKPIVLADLEAAWRAKKLAKEKALLHEQLLEGVHRKKAEENLEEVLEQGPEEELQKGPEEEIEKGTERLPQPLAEVVLAEEADELQDWAEAYAELSDSTDQPQSNILKQNLHQNLQQLNNLDQVIDLRKEDPPQSKPSYLNKPEVAKKNYQDYFLPVTEILVKPVTNMGEELDDEDILAKAALIEETLANFGVKAQVTDFSKGPTITRFEIQPAPGVKVSRIVSLIDDLALSLAATDLRIEAPIPGKAAVGIEVPNKEIKAVYLQELIEDSGFKKHSSKLAVALGKDIGGKGVVADLAKMPHLLVAGSTGSGKSVCMNSLISSILYKAHPDEVKFLMIDPKMVELSTYNGIPHLIAPVITDSKQATAALRWVVNEMENRYNLFATNAVKNLEGYNQLSSSSGERELPYIVVLIDELADLMMVASKDVEEAICRLAQKARAAGIHLVIATQRPSVDVITGLIKANIPSRIAFAVSSQIDSRTILDMAGAEKLLGRGDMLFYPIGSPKPQRIQGVYVSDQEVEALVRHVKSLGQPEYLEGIITNDDPKGNLEVGIEDDELLREVAQLIVDSGQASVSMLQRRFRIGYTRAARLIDMLEDLGVIGGYEGSKPREVLATEEDIKGLFAKI